jgi:hypothetical protein
MKIKISPPWPDHANCVRGMTVAKNGARPVNIFYLGRSSDDQGCVNKVGEICMLDMADILAKEKIKIS